MKSTNIQFLLIIEALLVLLLFFAEGYVRYATVLLFCIVDLFILIGIMSRRWGYAELFIFAAFFCSLIFIILYIFMQGTLTTALGIGMMLLYALSALLIYRPEPSRTEMLPMPAKPLETYDHGLETYDAKSEAKTRARAMAYELEREATELKRAESYVQKKKTEATELEAEREAKALEQAEKSIKEAFQYQKKGKEIEDLAKAEKKFEKELSKEKLKSEETELVHEATELEKADRYMRNRSRASKRKELSKEAKEIEDAEKQLKQVDFLNRQEQAIKQAREIAKVQEEIDKLKKKPAPKTITRTITKTAPAEKSMFVATKSGNRFHEPGCMAIKKTPKSKLVLFTSKKDALKKGYQPCDVCKP